MTSLQTEKSPYLLQHIDNPVDRYPWSGPAFRKLVQTVVLFKPDQAPGEISRLTPFVDETTMVDGQAVVYVCQGISCRAPITSAVERKTLLDTMP